MKQFTHYANHLFVGLGVLLCTSCQKKHTETMIMQEINEGWTYAQVDGTHKGSATIPGTIHTDLLANGVIEDPFFRTNERDQQWIDKEDWVYETKFTVSDAEYSKSNMLLDFKGLDTYADVFLNNKQILSADNMFINWKVDVKGKAQLGENTLRILFHSPIKKGLALLEQSEYGYPANNDQSENGGIGDKKVSIFTRKAGYHYGWDWGPRFVTSGVWRPVVLKSWDEFRIQNVFIQQPSVTADLAKLNAAVTINADEAQKLTLRVVDVDAQTTYVEKDIDVKAGVSTLDLPFEIKNPELWWTNGLGDAHLYNFEITVCNGNDLISSEKVTTGVRSIQLVREKDEAGESFLFELNGVRIFAKGANYIPNDNFLPRVTEDDYRKVIYDATHANMNMLRVWGGGIYENDIFYDLCDQNGILVWQDFMFACSMYPGDDKMLASIKQEATDNVIRLRNHPSIAVWCGNNEINTAWHEFGEGGWGWKSEYTEEQRKTVYKAYHDIFHVVLPEAVDNYAGGIAYWPSSPQAGFEEDKHASDETTSGDMHYWGVWHGLHKFEEFETHPARFMSEYGFQSFPDFETVKKYAIEEDFDIESDVMAAHQRSGIGNLRIKEYMSWDYNMPSNFEDFLYMSHVLQARGIKMAVEAHRRAMPYCMGTLNWQINDCWPVASWSSTDYYHKWKAMHYGIRRMYENVIVSAFLKDGKLEITGVSDLINDKEVELRFQVMDFNGKVVTEAVEKLTLEANTATLLKSTTVKAITKGQDNTNLVLNMEIVSGDQVLAHNNFFFSKPKDQTLPQANINIEKIEKDGQTFLKLQADHLVRDLYMNIPDAAYAFDDNYFDLMPGKPHFVVVDADINVDAIVLKHLAQI